MKTYQVPVTVTISGYVDQQEQDGDHARVEVSRLTPHEILDRLQASNGPFDLSLIVYQPNEPIDPAKVN